MPRSLLWLGLVPLLLLSSPVLAEPSARSLNARGYALYKQKQLAKALELFQQAVAANDRYALAHYNLACTLSLLRGKGKVCDHDAYQGTILEHLRKAVRLDPKLKEQALKDPDLASIRATFGYQILAGRSLARTEDLRAILVAVTWYGPAPGAYGPMSGLDFHEDGRLETWTLDVGGEKVRRVKRKARFTVELGGTGYGTTDAFPGSDEHVRSLTLTKNDRAVVCGHLGSGSGSDAVVWRLTLP